MTERNLKAVSTAAALVEKFEPLCNNRDDAKKATLLCIKECRGVTSVIGGTIGRTLGIYLDEVEEETNKL